MKKLLAVLVIGLLIALPTSASAAMPQFPNFFYGTATVDGVDAPAGWVVTAVVNLGEATERHYMLPVTPEGDFGGRRYNQRKLKVSGDLQGDVAHKSVILFFVTKGTLPFNTDLAPAGQDVFYADYAPHITKKHLTQG